MNGQVCAGAPLDPVRVGPDGVVELVRVLEGAGLPGDDVRLPGRRFFRFGPDGAAACYGGLEGDGPDRLLRSVVVPPPARGRGLGRAVVAALEVEAARLGAARLHLLTTTAARFFEGLGYRPAERAAAPRTIAATAQFASLCPASARYLVKDLSGA